MRQFDSRGKTRALQPKLSEIWGKPVIVENRTGGAGTMQAATVAKATPDGHTLLLISGQFAIGATLRPQAPGLGVRSCLLHLRVGVDAKRKT